MSGARAGWSGVRSGLAFTALGLLILIALAVWADVALADLWRAARRIRWWEFLIFAVMQGGVLILAAWKWRLILRRLPGTATTADTTPATGDGAALPMRDAVSATTLGTLAGQVLPIQVATPVIRTLAARRHGIAPARALGTSIFEQVFEVIVLAVMAALSAMILVLGINSGQAAVLALAAVAIVTGLLPQMLHLGAWGLRFLPLGRFGATLADGFSRAATLPRDALAVLTLLSFARYLLLVGFSVWCLYRLLPGIDPVPLVLAFPVILAIVSLPFIPAGLGLVEMSWAGVLAAAGVGVGEAAVAVIVLRLVGIASFLVTVPFLTGSRSGVS